MKKFLQRLWRFIWADNSLLSCVVNVVLAFIIIKFLVYPCLGFLLATTNPVVAVVSGSMEHHETFDEWWPKKADFYEKLNITKKDFEGFKFKNGFNKGDLMILKGKKPSELLIGQTIVFRGDAKEPVIHRLVSKQKAEGTYVLSTKGDNNDAQLSYEKNIPEEQLIGQALISVPFLGYVKIIFTEALTILQGGSA